MKSFLLTKTFPRACHFINTWLEVERHFRKNDTNLINIFFHEEMVKSKEIFYKRFSDTVNINTEKGRENVAIFENISNHNQRKGATDEWKSFFKEKELNYIKKHLEKIVSKNIP